MTEKQIPQVPLVERDRIALTLGIDPNKLDFLTNGKSSSLCLPKTFLPEGLKWFNNQGVKVIDFDTEIRFVAPTPRQIAEEIISRCTEIKK